VEFAVVQATDWNCVFVADFAAERARLGKVDAVRFARRSAAHDVGLGREISAVLFVAKPDGPGGDATAPISELRRKTDWDGRRSSSIVSKSCSREDAIAFGFLS
jgi:hypothetical protein